MRTVIWKVILQFVLSEQLNKALENYEKNWFDFDFCNFCVEWSKGRGKNWLFETLFVGSFASA
jgi:hypothetical protein